MADVIGTRIAGNLVFIDRAAHLRRWVHAFGPDVLQWADDFARGPVADALADRAWTVTRVEAGAGESTVATGATEGGVLVLTTDAAENDGLTLQSAGGGAHPGAAGLVGLYFGARFKVSDATQTDFFIGLSDTNSNVLGSVDDAIGFRKSDGSTAVQFVTARGGIETTAAAYTCDAAYHVVEFFIDGQAGSLEVFVDGQSIGLVATATLPDEALRVTMQFLTGEAVAKTMTVDWIRVVQIGGGRLAA